MENIANSAFWFNFIGITGVFMMVIAYFLVQTEKLKITDLTYILLNLFGAILHMLSLIKFWNLASFVIEVFWISIASYGLIKYIKSKRTA